MAEEAARKALELDPNLAEAHHALAQVAQNYEQDWSRAEAEYRVATARNPNFAAARHFYGEFLAYLGRFEESREQFARAQEIDPTSLILATDAAQTLMSAAVTAKPPKVWPA